MKKLYALVFSLTTFLLVTAPAYAGRLLSWRFDTSQNRLIFVTETSVKPVAQLIPNPTRLVIDLPGTILGRPKIEQSLGSVITTLRIGQFDPNTTRLVIELAPGYILDPRQIKIRGVSPTQWLVELPQPQPGEFPLPSASPQSPPANPQSPPANPQSPPANPQSPLPNPIRVTSNGLLIALGGNPRNKITVQRGDRRRLSFEIEGLRVTPNLLQSWPVNKYGVGELEISEKNNTTTVITLNLHPDSPDWQASFTTRGELLLWPQGGMTQVIDLPVAPPKPSNQSEGGRTLIEAIEVTNNQLSIRANLPIRARGSWINNNRIYEIRVDNASLAPNFQEPILVAESPISRIRILQPRSNSIIVQIEPARGVRIGEINQLSGEYISLPLTANPPFNPLMPPANAQSPPIPVTTFPSSVNPYDYTPGETLNPANNNPPPAETAPTFPPPRNQPNNRNPSRERLLVVIDPGHGGKDVGAVGVGGIFEKDIVLSISLQVARLLEQQGVQVRLTRNGDYFISLQERSEMANRLNADIFVSIHANSAGANKPNVNGYETYYYTPQSRALAESIHRNIIRRVNVVDRGIRTARFYVIRTTRMPSVLLETGFVTGIEDAAKLTNPTFQRQMAEAIAAGIIEYIKTRQR